MGNQYKPFKPKICKIIPLSSAWTHPKVNIDFYPCLLSSARQMQTWVCSSESFCLAFLDSCLVQLENVVDALRARCWAQTLPLPPNWDLHLSSFYFSLLPSWDFSLPFSRGPQNPFGSQAFAPHPEWLIAPRETQLHTVSSVQLTELVTSGHLSLQFPLLQDFMLSTSNCFCIIFQEELQATSS